MAHSCPVDAVLGSNDLLQAILSKLTRVEALIAAAVCRAWQKA